MDIYIKLQKAENNWTNRIGRSKAAHKVIVTIFLMNTITLHKPLK